MVNTKAMAAVCCMYHLPAVISYLLKKNHTRQPVSRHKKILEDFLEREKLGEWTIRRKRTTLIEWQD